MARIIEIYRDLITIDESFPSNLGMDLRAQPGDTLVAAARQLHLKTFRPEFSYVVAADVIHVVANRKLEIEGGASNPSPSITIVARTIDGTLQVSVAGTRGRDGEGGTAGDDAYFDTELHCVIKATSGGNGDNGERGGPAGNTTIQYVDATTTPIAASIGGAGGHGGPGGQGGLLHKSPIHARAKAGSCGKDGSHGEAGKAHVFQVSGEKVWAILNSMIPGVTIGANWAAYRVQVADYCFRKYDRQSQLSALHELEMIFQLDHDLDSQTVRTANTICARILRQQVPTGLARDLDLSPDYRTVSSALLDEITLLQELFIHVSLAGGDALAAQSARTELGLLVGQLNTRIAEAVQNVPIAAQDITIAEKESSAIESRLQTLKKELAEVQDRSFGFFDVLTTVGAIAGALGSIATGVGAMISIPAGLVAVGGAVKSLDTAAKILSSDELKKLGEGLKGAMTVKDGVVNLMKVIEDLEHAGAQAGQGDVASLLKQQAELVKQFMISGLRRQQAELRKQAAEQQVMDLRRERDEANSQYNAWTTQAGFLESVTDLMIRAAHRVSDLVCDDVFLAHRALEIYLLEDIGAPRFDYSYVHPDKLAGRSCNERAQLCIGTLAQLPADVLMWNEIYNRLNEGLAGYDIIEPVITVTLSESEIVNSIANGSKIQFSVAAENLPAGMFELKVKALSLELVGAQADEAVNVWVEHSGHWEMVRRIDSSIVEFNLLPHVAVFGCKPTGQTLVGEIPASPPTYADPTPPFSFWGRGVAATWRLSAERPVPPTAHLDLTHLTSVKVAFHCLGFAKPGKDSTVLQPSPKSSKWSGDLFVVVPNILPLKYASTASPMSQESCRPSRHD